MQLSQGPVQVQLLLRQQGQFGKIAMPFGLGNQAARPGFGLSSPLAF
jgi:hypothetical protein